MTPMSNPPDPQARREAILRLAPYFPGSNLEQISDRTKAIHHLLSSKDAGNDILGLSETALEEICSISFDELSQGCNTWNLLSRASPKRYRLLDCVEAFSNRTLRIVECPVFPSVPYAAISYGAEDADPIGLEVLTEACAAAQACGASYLWLDRLCIMQDSRQDKQWQVREMYRIYTFSTVCLVAPGGLRQLVPLSEETQWIHRSWTLQEVVAPPSVAVLFAWTHGSGTAHAKFQGEKTRARIEIVTSKTSAMLELGEVLDLCCVGYFEFTPDAEETTLSLRIETALLGKAPADVPKGKVLTDIRLPNVASLSFAAEVGSYMDTEDIRDACIWQCALVRTSSRPVDMVFSIMGILGVTLDSSEFEVDDRLGATIALAREILRQGRSASWLGMSAYLPPCPYLSTFPTFPRTSVAGKAMYNLPGGGQHSATLVDAIYPIDVGRFPILKGSMDEKGYHSFDAGAIKVIATSPAATMSTDSLYDDASRPAKLRALDGLVWMVGSDWPTSDSCDSPDFQLTQEPQSFAVIIGVFNGMFAVTMGDIIRAMLVTEHAKDRYHVRSYFLLNHEAMEWAASWKTRHFCVGGPATPSK